MSIKGTSNFQGFIDSEASSFYGLLTLSEGVITVQGKLEFGSTTSGDATAFSDTNYHIRFRKSALGTVPNQIAVVGNSGGGGTTSVQFGSISSGLTSGGLLVDINDATNNRWIMDLTNVNQTTIKFYGTKFSGAARLDLGSPTVKMDSIYLVNNKFESNDTIVFNIDSTDTTPQNQENSFSNSTSGNAVELYEIVNWQQQAISGNNLGLVLKSTTITFTLKSTTFANNTTDVYFWQPSGATTINLIDSTDNATASQFSSNNWNLYEKTTYDLNLKDESANAIGTAGVRLSRVYTGSLATTTHNPYQLRMRRDGHIPQQISGKSFAATALSDSFVLLNDDNFVRTASTVSLEFKVNAGDDTVERTSGSFVTDQLFNWPKNPRFGIGQQQRILSHSNGGCLSFDHGPGRDFGQRRSQYRYPFSFGSFKYDWSNYWRNRSLGRSCG